EDGIRDGHVTGVQTCALPICTVDGETRTKVFDPMHDGRRSYDPVDGGGHRHLDVAGRLDEPPQLCGGAVRDHATDGELSGEQARSEEHTSELQSRGHLVCRLL